MKEKETILLLNSDYQRVGCCPSVETNVCWIHRSIGKDWNKVFFDERNLVFCNQCTSKVKENAQKHKNTKKKKKKKKDVQKIYIYLNKWHATQVLFTYN